MAFRKSISKRLLISGRVSPCIPSSLKSLASKSNFHREYLSSPESRNKCFSIRRFFHRQTDSMLPDFLTLPLREKLRESLKGISNVRIDELSPPPVRSENFGVSVEDARKLMRVAQIERLKLKLKDIPESSISYAKFVQMCVSDCGNDDQGREMAKMLDQSGNVIVLGNTVFLRPQQVAESMGKVISESLTYQNENDDHTTTRRRRRREKLDNMEKQKALIDKKARALVRGELYCGLGFFLAQVVGAARLTFWELSWDVMEPICFFATSLHFGMGYLFFLKTSTEPTFEGFYKRRFQAKQNKLFKIHGFDVHAYNELLLLFNSKSTTGLRNWSPNSYLHC